MASTSRGWTPMGCAERDGAFSGILDSLSRPMMEEIPLPDVDYVEHEAVTELSEQQITEFRQSNNRIMVSDLSTKGGRPPPPRPVSKFEHAFYRQPLILDELKQAGFTTPTPVQCQMWPVLMSGYDCIGISQTGSGKTLGFLLPAFLHIEAMAKVQGKAKGPTVLVMTPTRELAIQIENEVRKYSYKGIRSTCIYGGGDRKLQVDHLRKGVEIVIGTPGRIADLMVTSDLVLDDVSYLILDEADRMLDLGFEGQIRKIAYFVRPTRRNVLTSATWPPIVREIAAIYTKDAFLVVIGTLDLTACSTVSQEVRFMNENEKRSRLMELIRQLKPTDKLLVFVGKKILADDLSSDLSCNGIECQAMHGSRSQEDREKSLADLRAGKTKILIATDLASRGIDIPDITHVVNYDFPSNIEEYVHRVGRTGRAGRSGISITFITRRDWAFAAELIKILENNDQPVIEELRTMAYKFEHRPQYPNSGRRPYGRRGGGNHSSFGAPAGSEEDFQHNQWSFG